MPTAKPFPFDALPRCTRRDASAMTALSKRLSLPPSLDLSSSGMSSLLGAPLRAKPRLGAVLPRDAVRASLDASALCAVFSHTSAGVVVLALQRPFARALALRALGERDGRAAHTPIETLSPAEEGALFALLSHAVTRVFSPAAPPVLRAVTDDVTDALDALGPTRSVLAWPFEVTLGDEATHATLLADPSHATRFAEGISELSPRTLDVPLAVTLVAARAVWSASELSSLEVSEVLSLDGLRVTRGGLAGDVTARVAAHLDCDARLEDGTVTLTETPHPITVTMADTDERSSLDDARITSIPVELTVEIARATSSVREVSTWRPGAVLTFETPIGEEVLVRANGRPVARGELVDVDGAVGVRVTALL